MRTQVERVESLPFGGGILHDEESGDGLILWVEEQRISEREAGHLEDNLNQAALSKGRHLTFAEVVALVPFVL